MNLLYGFVIIADCIIRPGINLLVKMITFDGIFSALCFMKTYFDHNLTDSQIISKSSSLYNSSFIDRYIYYVLLYGSVVSFNIFMWSDVNIIGYCSLMATLPIVVNKIMKTQTFQIVRCQKELMIKHVIAKFFTVIIKFYGKLYLNHNVKVKHVDIMPLLVDYKMTVGLFGDVLLNLLKMFGLSYVKKYSTGAYYAAIKYVYGYKTGEMLSSFDDNSAKNYLLLLIQDKKWKEFMKPNTCKALLHVYQTSAEESDVFKVMMEYFNMSMVLVISIWTLASLFGDIMFVPLLHLLLLYYRQMKKNDYDCVALGMLGFVGIFGLWCDNYLLMSMLCQYLYGLMFNKIMYKIVRGCWKKCLSYYLWMCENDVLVRAHLIMWIHVCVFSYIGDYWVMLLALLCNHMIYSGVSNILHLILIISTSISGHNMGHVLFNSMILYLLRFVRITWDDMVNVRSNLEYCWNIGCKKCKLLELLCVKSIILGSFDYELSYELMNVENDESKVNIIDNYMEQVGKKNCEIVGLRPEGDFNIIYNYY